MRTLLLSFLGPTALLLAATGARAQERFWRSAGLSGDMGGGALTSGGDLDGDGIADVVSGGIQSGGKGVVQVYGGVDGHLLYEMLGDKIGDEFGISAAMLSDIDGDGAADFMVGAAFNDWHASDAGSAYVYSGRSGALLKALHGQTTTGYFGASLAAAGDVDGDGFSDLLIGAPGDSTKASSGGAVFLYSGATFAPIDSIYFSRSLQAYFGSSVDGGKDVDGDGVADFIVGAPDDTRVTNQEGSATVYSGADRHVIWDVAGPSPVATLGRSVALLGDLDGDGQSEFAAGAPLIDHGSTDAGSVFIYSGHDVSVRAELDGSALQQELGASLASVGDVDEDGIADLLVGDDTGTVGADAGAARLFSGRTSRQLYRFDGERAGDHFGLGISATGDLDGDGLPDLVAGAPGADQNGNASGATYAFETAPLWLQFDPDILQAGTSYSLTIADGAPGATAALVLVRVDSAPTFRVLFVTTLDGNGEFTATGTLAAGLGMHEFELRAIALNGPSLPLVQSRDELVRTR